MQFATDFADPSNGYLPMECGLRGTGPKSRGRPVAWQCLSLSSRNAHPTQDRENLVSTKLSERCVSRIMQTERFPRGTTGKAYLYAQAWSAHTDSHYDSIQLWLYFRWTQ